MPTVLLINGYRFFFFSLDRFEPIHINVEKDESYAKYWLKPIYLANSRGFRQHELTIVRRMVEKYETTFIEKWNEYFSN
jgi:Domain of unknown function (DUF4160)